MRTMYTKTRTKIIGKNEINEKPNSKLSGSPTTIKRNTAIPNNIDVAIKIRFLVFMIINNTCPQEEHKNLFS
jgi:hypothetical protein